MFDNYKKYLEFLDSKLSVFFERQKPYIFCYRGCGKCCKNSQFPYSLMEITYLLEGYKNLDKTTQTAVEENIIKILEAKRNFCGAKFQHDCPFLINNECSVYEYRGVVCRAFGLMTYDEDGTKKAPFCYSEGLNYSNVIDLNTETVSQEKFEALNVEEEPLAFNVSYKFLTSTEFEKDFNFKFKDKKPMIEWFIENI